jgi:hypothetical protein
MKTVTGVACAYRSRNAAICVLNESAAARAIAGVPVSSPSVRSATGTSASRNVAGTGPNGTAAAFLPPPPFA